MTFPGMVAENPQPYTDAMAALPGVPSDHITALPQSWQVSIADAKYHWYDLIAGFPEAPDIRDPVGRYVRRMQFELEAAAESRLLFFAVTRPRVRFDTTGTVQWGFFSLKLTLPLLIGPEQSQMKENITLELKVPFAATLKKPTVTLKEHFITLNWGGLIEAFSVHDVLQNYGNVLRIPSRVIYVGQTRDEAHRLSKGRLPAVQKLHQQSSGDVDTLLLVMRLDVQADSHAGDPTELEANQHPLAADALQRDRMDIIEAALMRYFEGEAPRHRNQEERTQRRERLAEAQATTNLAALTIDLQVPEAGNYVTINSEQRAAAPHHRLSCDIINGEARVAALPLPPAKSGKKG